jgi:septum site-determining protein MinD
MGNGVVFAVAGSKGGVGKTTTSINLSAVLAEAGCDVVLVEVDLAMANVGDFLDIDVGLEGEDPTLHEVLAGTATVVDATYDSPCTFDVVPSGATLRRYGDADIGRLPEVLSTLRFAYDVVVLDTGAGVTAETVLPLAVADETILVSSPRVASVRDTMKTRDITRQVGGTVAGVVFVKSGTGRSPDVDHIADFLSVELLGHVPEDSAVANAQDVGLPVVAAASESDAAAAYRTLGDRVVERVEALGTSSTGVLSAESIDSDGSGFAFVDRPTTDDGTENPERAGDDSRTTNGRAGERTNGAAEEMLSLTRTNGDGPEPNAVATPNHDPDGPDDPNGPNGPDDADGDGVADVDVATPETAPGDDDTASMDHDDQDRSPGPSDVDGPDETAADDVVAGAEPPDADGPTEADEGLAATDEGGQVDAAAAATEKGVGDAADVDETETENTANDDTGVGDFDGGDVVGGSDGGDGDTTDDTSETDNDGGGTTGGDTTDEPEPADPADSETADAAVETGDENGSRNGAQRDGTESPRSAPKRFIDRAKDLVDRRSD